MAIAKETWQKAKDLFELGKSLNYIADTLEIDKSTISKKSKKENWQKSINQPLKDEIIEYEVRKSTLEQEKSTLVEKVAKLDDFQITTLSELIEEETKISSLITSTSTLALIRTNQLLTENTKKEKLYTRIYKDGVSKEKIDLVDIPLEAKDYKEIVDTIDKASITLGVNQRHANQAIQVNNQNTQENNNLKVTFE